MTENLVQTLNLKAQIDGFNLFEVQKCDWVAFLWDRPVKSHSAENLLEDQGVKQAILVRSTVFQA